MNRTRTAVRACVALMWVGAVASAHASTNLLTNGSFELGTFTNQGQDTETFTAGSTVMTGWTTTGNFVSWIGATNPFSLSAQDGSYFLDLTGYHAGAPFGGVTQTIATTPGKQYDLSFYLGSYTAVWGGPPVSITAAAGGTSELFTNGSATSSSTWTLENLPFTAAGTSTTISLLGEAGFNYIGLDNVAVQCVNTAGCATTGGGGTAVPEPAVFGLMSLGLAAVGLGRRRQLRAAANY
ncbi:MAG TPA: DUF642 domain-containing protein [Steroidobacteraceae bacterium]|jgi:hypothetical protein|nr:DUF642 domain-containing protein [Steroidobacteraceae bacterium]